MGARKRVVIQREIGLERDRVARAIRELRPTCEPTGDGGYRWVEFTDVQNDAVFHSIARLHERESSTTLELETYYDAHVPYFWWVFDGLIKRSAVGSMRDAARAVEDAASGVTQESTPPKQPWWAPPVAMNRDQIRVVATVSILLAVVGYGGALLTQTVDYVATTYGATNADIGVVTAVTRVGTIVALIGGVLADRVGRRRLILWSVALVSIATALTAFAPNLVIFAVLQLLVRGGSNLAFGVAFIAAVEDAPERARTYTIAVVGIASGIGYVVGVSLLPLADLGSDVWRVLYGIGIVGLLFLPSFSRNLTETTRFTALEARGAPRGRMREVVDSRYRGRFFLLCAIGFLLNLFFAPESQFTNRYLGNERGFSGAGILVLRAVTQAVPSLVAGYAGGKLAESWGRKPTAYRGLLVTAVFTALFFGTTGPLLWIGFAIASASIAAAGPSLSAFGSELFPTEVRGTAGAGLTLAAVLGSVTGLLLVGYLAAPLGSVGTAVAVTCVAPLFVALVLIPRLPEARGKLLDDVSPSEV